MPLRILFLTAVVAITAACAAVQPLNPGAPRRNQPPYPAVLTEITQRIEAARAAWLQIISQQGVNDKSEVPMQPITSTIRSLPENFTGALYLPKIGVSAQMNEEETRESLRRFLRDWKTLLGTDPAQLTLINDTPANDGTRTVVYEQRPFTYPLRGDYGKVEVRFASDRRILNVSSTAIPDSVRIQSTLNSVVPQIKAEDVASKLVNRTVTYTDSLGPHTFTISSAAPGTVQQLVVYPRLQASNADALEFHLAWEIALTNAPVAKIYLDAL